MSIVAIIVYVPSLMLDIFLTFFITSWKWYNRIDDAVILGGLPFTHIKEQLLKKENVKAVVSMNEDFELFIVNGKDEWEKEGVEFLQLPTPDIFQSLSQSKLKTGVEFICDYISKSTNSQPKPAVYVHCKSGKTRSATLVGCYLMQRNGWSPEEAVEYIKKKRPQIMLHTKQWEALRTFHRNLSES